MGCIGIGSKKKASKVSSMIRRTSTAEGANRSLFAREFQTYKCKQEAKFSCMILVEVGCFFKGSSI